MDATDRAAPVRALWDAFNVRDWDRAAKLLSPDFVVDWPQSRERIRGIENFLAVNRNYPGNWWIHVEAVHVAEDVVVSRIRIDIDGRTDYGLSFFKVEGGLLRSAVEYWGETYPAPEWRRQWVEPLP
ncbi:MAG TPA: nuclear transport factor 2 family protein [Candidatus Thermoplasmatota archaeon]|nr:nuclear transport factor 2 family protein [Candidatus Thermoplasmatota archaeon]